jgi:hypothetical protein
LLKPFHTLTRLSRFVDEISHGKVQLTPDVFPNFLYNDEFAETLVEDNLEDWDPEMGLLRSSLCVWVGSFAVNA